jgi:hypothetical protein
MWQTTHLFTGHSAIHLVPALRTLQRHAWHALQVKLADPVTIQALLLAMATILFVLACLGLILVGGTRAY